MPTATQLHPLFAVRISGIDIGRRLSMKDAAWVRCMISADPARVDPAPVIEAEWAVRSSVRDNRAVMHRAIPFASTTKRWYMVRTTTSCSPATL